MRVIFMGTPDFSVPALEALIKHHEVVAVYSQPPRPKGRGKEIQLSPVHQKAQEHNIPVHNPVSFKEEGALETFIAIEADVVVVVAYGLLLPAAIVDQRLCLNIHASLLPRWRGAAPIQRAIAAGDTTTGIGIMKMDQGLDTGDILIEEALAITPTMNAEDLHDLLQDLGAQMIIKALKIVCNKTASYSPQLGEATYAHKLKKGEEEINWNQSAEIILNHIRAFAPWPGAFMLFNDERLKIFEARILSEVTGQAPGSIIDEDFKIACLDGAVIQPTLVQRPGKKKMRLESFLQGIR